MLGKYGGWDTLVKGKRRLELYISGGLFAMFFHWCMMVFGGNWEIVGKIYFGWISVGEINPC